MFQKALIELCAAIGEAVVFVPELPKTGVAGATRWLGPDKALIQISLRYKTDDHLWFTFFHEAGHVVLHGKKAVFLEGNGMNDAKEDAANRFAANFLIPSGELKTFIAASRPTFSEIQDFASRLGIAPGIVVGRLQHEDILPRNTGNGLKRSFRWRSGGG